MVNKVIADYMRTSRRLILPEVGALLRRTEGGEIVFVEIFKQNDGVLTNLVAEKMGIELSQASVMVEHFITALRGELQSAGSYTIPSLGTLRTTANSIIFVAEAAGAQTTPSDPAPKPAAPRPTTPTLFPSEADNVSATSMTESPAPRPKPASQVTQPSSPTRKTGHPTEYYAHSRVHEPQNASAEPSSHSNNRESVTTRNTQNAAPRKQSTNSSSPARSGANRGPSSPRSINERPNAEHFRISTHRQSGESDPARIRIRTNRKRKKPDMVTILAIIAVIIAILVIVYGLVSSPGPVIDEPLLPTPDTMATEMVEPLTTTAE